MAAITIFAWLIAEAIPFFADLLSLMSALFISGFSFYFPALMWFLLLRKGRWWEGRNLAWSALNAAVLGVGVVVLVAGTYAAVVDIVSFPAGGDGWRANCGVEGSVCPGDD